MQMWSQGFASDSPQQLNSGSVHSEALPAGHLVRQGPASQQSIDKCFSNAPGNALFKKLSVLIAAAEPLLQAGHSLVCESAATHRKWEKMAAIAQAVSPSF